MPFCLNNGFKLVNKCFFRTCFSVAVVLSDGTTVCRPKHVIKVYLVQLLEGTWTCVGAWDNATCRMTTTCEWEAFNMPP